MVTGHHVQNLMDRQKEQVVAPRSQRAGVHDKGAQRPEGANHLGTRRLAGAERRSGRSIRGRIRAALRG